MQSKFFIITTLCLSLMACQPQQTIQNNKKTSPIVGFWEVEKVTVGKEKMTPVAKWFKLNANNTFEGGNGWMQNSEGTYTYDGQKYQPITKNGLKDPFGAFQVSFENDKMIWERQEEGMKVIVTLKRIVEKPKSPADQVVGLWDLTKAEKEGKDVTTETDKDNLHYIFIRWDRFFVQRTPKGDRDRGYWHFHGHKPEITFIHIQRNNESEPWRVDVTENTLTLTGIADTNKGIVLSYIRLDGFPKGE
jgi:hypothetical protein